MAEIRLREVNDKTKAELSNITSHLGITENQFLKVEISKLVKSYPEEMRSKPNRPD